MESCKFHPVTPSKYNCPACQEEFCDSCVDHSVPAEPSCFLCGGPVVFHVTTDNIDPFWRRLEKAFRYPLNMNAMMIIVGLSIASVVLTSMPFQGLITLILNLIVAGMTVNYAFMCLKATSEGDMTPPQPADAFSGSLSVLFRLFLMTLLIAFGIYAVGSSLGPGLAMVAVAIIVIGLPAILMCFAYTDSMLQAINPVNFIRLMVTTGLSYAVLVIFLMIMISSVSVLREIIGHDLAALSALIQASIGNYYAVVMFHLMGYMLYQYQEKLGIAADNDDHLITEAAEPADVALAHANVRLKLGDYDRVDEILSSALDVTRKDKRLWQRYFDFLIRCNRPESLQKFADKYLRHLIETAQTVNLSGDYKRILQLLPKFQPEDPHVRYYVANAVRSSGDSMMAVRLLNGMHKKYPEYENLVGAYVLMREALSDLPNMEAQVAKCGQLIAALQKKFPQKTEAPKPQAKAVFDIPEETAEPVEQKSANKAQDDPQGEAKQQPPEDNRGAPIEFKL